MRFCSSPQILPRDVIFRHSHGSSSSAEDETIPRTIGCSRASDLGVIQRHSSDNSNHEESPSLVAISKQSISRIVIPSSSSSVCSDNGCIPGRLGSTSARHGNKWQMDCLSFQNTHQFSGTVGDFAGPSIISPEDNGVISPHTHRQHHLHALSKQAGWNEIPDPLLGRAKAMGMGIEASNYHQSGAPPRNQKQPCRYLEQVKPVESRVGIKSDNNQPHLSYVGEHPTWICLHLKGTRNAGSLPAGNIKQDHGGMRFR